MLEFTYVLYINFIALVILIFICIDLQSHCYLIFNDKLPLKPFKIISKLQYEFNKKKYNKIYKGYHLFYGTYRDINLFLTSKERFLIIDVKNLGEI